MLSCVVNEDKLIGAAVVAVTRELLFGRFSLGAFGGVLGAPCGGAFCSGGGSKS